MTKDEFDGMINKLLDAGLTISLSKQGYDLNTGMKSGLTLTFNPENGQVWGDGRYTGFDIENWDDLVNAAYNCLSGREYMSPVWKDIFISEGLIEVEVVPTEKIIFKG